MDKWVIPLGTLATLVCTALVAFTRRDTVATLKIVEMQRAEIAALKAEVAALKRTNLELLEQFLAKGS